MLIFTNKQLRVYLEEMKIGLCRKRVHHESEHLKRTGGFINTDGETEQEKRGEEAKRDVLGSIGTGELIAERESQFLFA